MIPRLLNAADGLQLWSEKFDRSRSDIFAVEDDIARLVAALLMWLATRAPRSRSTSLRMALANIRERLQLFFDAEARLETVERSGRYRVEIEIPYRLRAPGRT